MGKKMVKAAVMVAPGIMEVQEFPYPNPKRGAMVIEMEMSGICGTDKHAYKGEMVLYAGTEAEQRGVFPCVKGHENVGRIVEMNGPYPDYDGEPLMVGDRVTMCPNIICGKCYYCRHVFGWPYCAHNKTYGVYFRSDKWPHVTGGWAEYMYIFPGSFVYKVPEDMPAEIAVNIELMVVTNNVDRAKGYMEFASRGFGLMDSVLIQGVGAMGLAHLIKCRVLGAGDIIALDTSDYRLKLAKEFGADHLINVTKTTFKERLQMVRDLTHGRGADMVIETTGLATVVPEGLDLLRRGGTYLEAGNFVDSGETTINVHRHLAAKNVLLLGNTNHPNSEYYRTIAMMQRYKKQFPWKKFTTHKFPLDKAQEALEYSLGEKALKVVFDMTKQKVKK
jgi:threonine dehydrogenase-like Zn-dependent dehydrogenase